MKLILAKISDGTFVCVGEESLEAAQKIKIGEGVQAAITRIRNLGHHRKGMKMLTVAYGMWKGQCERKGGQMMAFDPWRKRVMVLAGYFDTEFELDGTMRLEAKSLSFGSMDQTEFDGVYQALITALLERVLDGISDDEFQHILSFA